MISFAAGHGTGKSNRELPGLRLSKGARYGVACWIGEECSIYGEDKARLQRLSVYGTKTRETKPAHVSLTVLFLIAYLFSLYHQMINSLNGISLLITNLDVRD